MKKVVIQCKPTEKPFKETEEERKERLRLWATTRTRTVPDKKHTYNRKKYKKSLQKYLTNEK